jgi:cyclic pyranopterin phosphate synthase
MSQTLLNSDDSIESNVTALGYVMPLERLRDSYGRAITDLRLSVTDRCNYRCVYCRNGEDGLAFRELGFEEYVRILRVFVSLGIEKIRFTGGEPLLRRDLPELIQAARELSSPFTNQLIDLALTTNGHLLAPMAQTLRDAGLGRITVSMDGMTSGVFEGITRVPGSFNRVISGVRAAQNAGLGVKVNCVLLRGFNDGEIEAFAEFSRTENVVVRFIEFMPLEEPVFGPHTPVGARTWTRESVVTLDEIVARLNAVRPLVELPPLNASETAKRYTFDDGLGEIGIIAPVSRPFCGECSRVRVTSDGKIRTCLFSQTDHDLAGQMKGTSDDELRTYIRRIILRKEARHHIGEPGFLKPSRSMVHIGG